MWIGRAAGGVGGEVGLGRGRPRLPSGGGGRTAGAFLGLLNQPSSDGETGNATSRNSFLRLFKIDGIADEPAGVSISLQNRR